MKMMRANVYDKPGHCEITQVMSCGICKGADVALA